MRQPTRNEIEDAKAYIRERVDAELSAYSHIDLYMKEAARRILKISYRYNIPPEKFRFSENRQLEKEVNEVIEWLKMQIEDAVFTLAGAKAEKEDNIAAYISRETFGATFAQRNDTYARRWKYEIEAAVAAGLILGYSMDKTLKSVYDNFKKPYLNPLIRDAARKGNATRLKTAGISYGVGRTNAMHTALTDLGRMTVADGWMQSLYLRHKDSIGFYSFRGSSYPCSLCDDMVGFHPIEDFSGIWHGRCKCFFVFI